MIGETPLVQIVALVGWLVLAVGAFASYKLSWGKAARMALTWLGIFLGIYVLFSLVQGG